MRVIQRQIEASLGGALLKLGAQDGLRRSKLVQKRVYLPRFGLHMNYLEREASSCNADETNKGTSDDQPTLLFCHGLSDNAKNMAMFINSLSIPGHIRVLLPDQIGHGADLERAKSDPDSYEHPTPTSMLESTSEFLDVVQVGNNCHAFGISLGGAIVYYLQYKRPDVIRKSVLISPALHSCVGKAFIEDFVQGRKRHMCIESRQDVKILFRDLSTASPKRKNPIPKFFLEAVYRDQKKRAPEGHYKEMLDILINEMYGETTPTKSMDDDTKNDKKGNIFRIDEDIDPQARRLVLWPDQGYVCNHESGKRFFKDSTSTEFETISDCGHIFHSDGTFILDLVRARVGEYLLNFAPSAAHKGTTKGDTQ